MKAEEFIVGNWYMFTQPGNTHYIRFRGIIGEDVQYSERIETSTGIHYKRLGKLLKPSLTFIISIPIKDIQLLLPNGHEHKYKTNVIIQAKNADGLVSTFIDKPNVTSLSKFPDTGTCHSITLDLILYLDKSTREKPNVKLQPKHSAVCWNIVSWWFVSVQSDRPEYTIEQLNPFILTKIKQNEVSSTKTEESGRCEHRAISLRSRGQQITTGSRCTGNSTSIIKCKKRINSIKITKSAISTRYIE